VSRFFVQPVQNTTAVVVSDSLCRGSKQVFVHEIICFFSDNIHFVTPQKSRVSRLFEEFLPMNAIHGFDGY
jgi:hypothetical protein